MSRNGSAHAWQVLSTQYYSWPWCVTRTSVCVWVGGAQAPHSPSWIPAKEGKPTIPAPRRPRGRSSRGEQWVSDKQDSSQVPEPLPLDPASSPVPQQRGWAALSGHRSHPGQLVCESEDRSWGSPGRAPPAALTPRVCPRLRTLPLPEPPLDQGSGLPPPPPCQTYPNSRPLRCPSPAPPSSRLLAWERGQALSSDLGDSRASEGREPAPPARPDSEKGAGWAPASARG